MIEKVQKNQSPDVVHIEKICNGFSNTGRAVMKKATVIGILCLVLLQFLQTASSEGRIINTVQNIVTFRSCRN